MLADLPLELLLVRHAFVGDIATPASLRRTNARPPSPRIADNLARLGFQRVPKAAMTLRECVAAKESASQPHASACGRRCNPSGDRLFDRLLRLGEGRCGNLVS